MAREVFDFYGRNALVTGCGSADGIGFATASLLARLGANVATTSTTPERIEARAAELRVEGADVSSHVADLTDREQALGLVAAARATHGPIHVLVNAAGMVQTGTAPVTSLFAELDPQDLQRELEITLKTAFHTTQAALPDMAKRGYGRIIMVSSVTGPFATAHGSTAYATAKAGMGGMMRTIALEYGRLGVTANSVAPGSIATASLEPEELAAGRHTPVGRPGTPKEVAGLIAIDRGRRRQPDPGAARGRPRRSRVARYEIGFRRGQDSHPLLPRLRQLRRPGRESRGRVERRDGARSRDRRGRQEPVRRAR